MEAQETTLRGYTTSVMMVRPTLRAPCPDHYEDDWLDRAVDALEHGWPEGARGGPWRADCPACQRTAPARLGERVVGWDSNDPRAVGVDQRGEVILIDNPFRRAWWKLTHRRSNGAA